MIDTPHNIKLIIPKPNKMSSREYQKRMKQLVKVLEILEVRVIAREYESK